jgi:hypothetical protein
MDGTPYWKLIKILYVLIGLVWLSGYASKQGQQLEIFQHQNYFSIEHSLVCLANLPSIRTFNISNMKLGNINI